MPPLKRISIGGYRAASELDFEPRSVCALVGEASSGKSTVLTAIWTLLEAAAPPPTIDDVSRVTSGGRIHLEADVERGRTIFLDARPPRHAQSQSCRRTACAVPPGESAVTLPRRAGNGSRSR